MNEIARNYLHQLDGLLDDLQGLLEAQKGKLAKEHQEQKKMRQESWSRDKEVAVLETAVQDYHELQTENEGLAQANQQLTDGLERLLGYTNTLTDALRR